MQIVYYADIRKCTTHPNNRPIEEDGVEQFMMSVKNADLRWLSQNQITLCIEGVSTEDQLITISKTDEKGTGYKVIDVDAHNAKGQTVYIINGNHRRAAWIRFTKEIEQGLLPANMFSRMDEFRVEIQSDGKLKIHFALGLMVTVGTAGYGP